MHLQHLILNLKMNHISINHFNPLDITSNELKCLLGIAVNCHGDRYI